MAQDIGFDFAAGPTLTLLASDLTDTNASALTTKVDFGAIAPVGCGYELIITGDASAIDLAFLEGAWSHDDSDYTDLLNLDTLATIQCVASGDAKKVGAFEIKARFLKFRLQNETGGVIDGTASNTALILTDIFYNQA